MNFRPLIFALALLPAAAGAHGNAIHAPKAAEALQAEPEQQPWGIAASRAAATRTITIRMDDHMRFTPRQITVREGETLRIITRNAGTTLHEMVIGTGDALAEHAELMKKFPDMEHDAPWMAHVPPGGTGEIVWTFNRPGRFDFACLIPGHFETGMTGTIDVRAASAGKAAAPQPATRGPATL